MLGLSLITASLVQMFCSDLQISTRGWSFRRLKEAVSRNVRSLSPKSPV